MAHNRARELDRLYQMRHPPRGRAHLPHISISHDRHHVTEAIGDMYGGDSDTEPSRRISRPLSFIPSPNGDSIQSLPAFDPFPGSPPARSPLRPQMALAKPATPTSPTGAAPLPQKRPSSARRVPNGHRSPPLSPARPETAAQPFPLNDLDYESSPAGLAQELSNLQAIRRMSMGVNNADPDLPSFQSTSSPPGSPPAIDHEDESKLFWVPARLHPELAPMEFKTFIEEKVDKIRRRSGDSDSLSPDSAVGRPASGAALRRRKSMLSRQIDTGSGYKDGAERLEMERKRSGAHANGGLPDLQEIEHVHEDPAAMIERMSGDSKRSAGADGDMPIVRGSQLGGLGTLKRSTHTTYRRGSLRKGGPPLSRRLASGRQAETDTEESPSTSPVYTLSEPPPPLPVQRVQSEPMNGAFESESNFSRPQRRPSPPEGEQERPGSAQDHSRPAAAAPNSEGRTSPQPRQFHSRIASNGRTTAPLPGYSPQQQQQVPQIIETPPPPDQDRRQYQLPERHSSRQPPPQAQQPPTGPRTYNQPQSLNPYQPQQQQQAQPQLPQLQQRQPPASRQNRHAQASSIQPAQSFDDLLSHPTPLPGNANRVDTLSIIPNIPEEKKSEKKSKDKKDSTEGPRKTSWGWLVGGDKDKERDKKDKDDKEKESAKKVKNKLSKPQEKGHDDTRLDLLQTSIQNGGRGRESIVLDREAIKLEEERKKESNRKTSSDGKKEKEPGLLSTIFGGGKKKSDKDASHKKTAARGLSPEPPQRILKPDIDYNWTRFSILEERAIYRMAHIKLANPRRELYSQVLLSNFMYSYLAKVQQMHPQISIGNSKQARLAQKKEPIAQQSQPQQQQAQQQAPQQLQPQAQPQQQPQQSQPQQQAQPEEFAQYQRYQQQQQQQTGQSDNKSNEWPSHPSQDSNQPQQNGHRQQQGNTYNLKAQDAHQSNYGATGAKSYSVANTQNYLGQSSKSGHNHYSDSDHSSRADDDMW